MGRVIHLPAENPPPDSGGPTTPPDRSAVEAAEVTGRHAVEAERIRAEQEAKKTEATRQGDFEKALVSLHTQFWTAHTLVWKWTAAIVGGLGTILVALIGIIGIQRLPAGGKDESSAVPKGPPAGEMRAMLDETKVLRDLIDEIVRLRAEVEKLRQSTVSPLAIASTEIGEAPMIRLRRQPAEPIALARRTVPAANVPGHDPVEKMLVIRCTDDLVAKYFQPSARYGHGSGPRLGCGVPFRDSRPDDEPIAMINFAGCGPDSGRRTSSKLTAEGLGAVRSRRSSRNERRLSRRQRPSEMSHWFAMTKNNGDAHSGLRPLTLPFARGDYSKRGSCTHAGTRRTKSRTPSITRAT